MTNRVSDSNISTMNIIDAKTVINPMIKLGKYIGLIRSQNNSKNGNRKCTNALNIVYILIVQVLFMAMTVKFILGVFNETKLGRLLPLLAISVNSGGIAFSSLATLFTFNKNCEKFVMAFNDHQTKFGVMKFESVIKRFLKWVTVIIMCMNISYSLLYCYLLYVGKHQLKNVLYPLNFDDLTNTMLSFTLLVLHQVYQMAHLHTINSFAYYSFVVILIEFYSLVNDLKVVMQKHVQMKSVDPDFEIIIETLRLRHLSLINILDHMNSIIAHMLFAIFSSCIPIVCFVLYGNIRHVLSISELNLISTISSTYCFVPVFLLLFGSLITLKAHEPLSHLVDIDIATVTDNSYRSISLFISRLTASKIGFTVYEMFTLDVTAVVMVLGTLVTYAVVMIQFS